MMRLRNSVSVIYRPGEKAYQREPILVPGWFGRIATFIFVIVIVRLLAAFFRPIFVYGVSLFWP